jgi:hypothetical protein
MLRSDHSAFSTRLPLLPAVLLALLGLAALGCTPHIGDECTVSTNCSTAGDRLCDITEPGGYCTIFNCEPDSCPDDALCINFGTALSPVDQCYSSQGNSPYQRSFCMAACSVDSDCRGGYSCQDLSGGPGHPKNEVGAVLADISRTGKVCAVTRIADAASDAGTSNEVCLGSDAGPAAAGGADAGDASRDSGAGGAPSDAGAGG